MTLEIHFYGVKRKEPRSEWRGISGWIDEE
jgi:hypothetical protein